MKRRFALIAVAALVFSCNAVAHNQEQAPGVMIRPPGIVGIQPVGPVLWISTTNLDFGYIAAGETVTNQLMLQNLGRGVFAGKAATATPFNIVSGGTYSLGLNETHLIRISYKPSGATNDTGSVALSGGEGVIVEVEGHLKMDPELSVSPRRFDFGPVARGSVRTNAFTVRNSGAGTLAGAASATEPFRIVFGRTFSLGPSQSQVVLVSYSPIGATNDVGVITFIGSGKDVHVPVSGSIGSR